MTIKGSVQRPSERLRNKVGLVLPNFHSLTQQLWGSSDLRARYVAYLVLMHQMVRATVPLMQKAIEHCDMRAKSDPVAAGLALYLRVHIREERGHDEWVRSDLKLITPDADKLLASMPSPAVANIVGSQYYWMIHHHPISLLGHIAVLEGYPPSTRLADVLAKRSGLPIEAFRTLRRHAVLDQRHRDEVFATIDALPLTEKDEGILGVSALHTVAMLIPAFSGLCSAPVTTELHASLTQD
ncbi:iron-containing redox enzyme family protein [Streptomyces chartreusis]|uniref:iron-containing redox enzyme family protein n=1 Tax=Streptomyces chartreusis TaxID=1969 RepID=UPI003805A0DF